MTRSTKPIELGTAFDAFLFASVNTDEGSERLSVLSALARLDLDPWREAAALAGTSKPAARLRLASLIANLGNTPATGRSAAATAERLVALLPVGGTAHADPTPTGQSLVNVILINLVMVAGMILVQWSLANARPPAADAPGIAQADTAAPQPPQQAVPR